MFDRLFGRSGPSIATISPRDAWERYTSAPSDVALIDVREAWEFSRGHAKGARNIPLSAFTRRLKEIPTDKHTMLICQSGHRSMQAAQALAAHGYERVSNISGGTAVWRMSQLPME
ncbi:MAG TPA: rhodanese-like domain-containing protein [Ktedonobacterales bacterium]|nr:rhodanese-like domain-containing protein [Ktedonobacterales bacterium]